MRDFWVEFQTHTETVIKSIGFNLTLLVEELDHGDRLIFLEFDIMGSILYYKIDPYYIIKNIYIHD